MDRATNYHHLVNQHKSKMEQYYTAQQVFRVKGNKIYIQTRQKCVAVGVLSHEVFSTIPPPPSHSHIDICGRKTSAQYRTVLENVVAGKQG